MELFLGRKDMCVNAKKVQSALLHQMEQYLDGKITKEEYTIATETFYSRYAYLIVDTRFYEIFSKAIPDCCIVNVEEPGDEVEKERDFRRIVKETYKKLRMMLN